MAVRPPGLTVPEHDDPSGHFRPVGELSNDLSRNLVGEQSFLTLRRESYLIVLCGLISTWLWTHGAPQQLPAV